MPLTAQQLAFFDTFGYLAFPGLFADRAQLITDAFERVWTDRGQGHNGTQHDGMKRSCFVPFIDHSDELSALIDDPRIADIATGLLGDDFNYMGSDGNFYSGETGWHSDGWRATVRHIKIAFYLDPLDADSGGLRVIPGSHQVGDRYGEALNTLIPRSKDTLGFAGCDLPAMVFTTRPGDVLCFNHNTKHASFNGGPRRRMFTINLCQRYPQEKVQELRDYVSTFSRFWLDRVYGPRMVATANPRRSRHLEQVMANDGHLAELSRQARETMKEPSRG